MSQYYQNDTSGLFQYMWRHCTIKNLSLYISQNLYYSITLYFIYSVMTLTSTLLLNYFVINMAFAQLYRNIQMKRESTVSSLNSTSFKTVVFISWTFCLQQCLTNKLHVQMLFLNTWFLHKNLSWKQDEPYLCSFRQHF